MQIKPKNGRSNKTKNKKLNELSRLVNDLKTNDRGSAATDNIARIKNLTNKMESVINKFQKVSGSDVKHMELMKKRASGFRSGVVGNNESGYSWRKDGNLITTPMSAMSALQTADYNAVYATVGGPHFPVPLPQTNSESNGFSYTANVGYLSLTRTIVSPSTDTTYVVMTCTPEAVEPFHICSRTDKDNYFSFPPTNVGDYKKNNAPSATSNWVQTDPRTMIAGETPSPSAFQQFMGGEIRGQLSVPWNGIATVAVLDPMIAPSYLGNKMNHLAIGRTGFDLTREFEYYAMNGIHVHGAGSQDMPASRLFEMASSRAVLNGGGNASTFGFGWRQIPNTQEWVYLANNADITPGPFNGSPIIVIELPPGQTISIAVAGHLAYNVSVDPTTAVGALLSQDSPIATPHSTNVRNIPMTVNCGNTSVHPEYPYTGVNLQTTSNRVQPIIGYSAASPKGASGLRHVMEVVGRAATTSLNTIGSHVARTTTSYLKGVLSERNLHELMRMLAARAADAARQGLVQVPRVAARASPLLLM